MATASGVKTLISVEYEVFGKVQGVFFRKYTEKNAKKRGLVGFVQNTRNGTVVGVIQGPQDKVLDMKKWLSHTGSPRCRIDKCVFSPEQPVTTAAKAFKEFSIRRDLKPVISC